MRDLVAHGSTDDRTSSRPPVARLLALFAAFYVFQAVCDTEGLIAQPVAALLRSWGWSAGQITRFFALVGAPWLLKPLFGLLTDYVPLGGYRRKSYLVVAGATAALALGAAAAGPLDAGAARLIFGLLFVAALGASMADVTIDALMVEVGQPLGLTGRFQSVQWTAIYAAGIVGAMLGGRLSDGRRERIALAIAAGVAALATVLAALFVRESPQPASPLAAGARRRSFASLKASFDSLRASLWRPGLPAIAGFLFLWNFNPFSARVLQIHMTEALGMSQRFVGDCDAVYWVAATLGSLSYGFYCRRAPLGWLLHGSIALGVFGSICYVPMEGEASALVASAASGLATATATLIQLDLAARLCPPAAAGAAFALLMAVSNLGMQSGFFLGGDWYERLQASLGGAVPAFRALVLIGGGFTAGCWLLVGRLRGALERTP